MRITLQQQDGRKINSYESAGLHVPTGDYQCDFGLLSLTGDFRIGSSYGKTEYRCRAIANASALCAKFKHKRTYRSETWTFLRRDAIQSIIYQDNFHGNQLKMTDETNMYLIASCPRRLLFITLLASVVLFAGCQSKLKNVELNLDFESADSNDLPQSWNMISSSPGHEAKIALDSLEVEHGKYSLLISNQDSRISYVLCMNNVSAFNKGSEIELTGYLKSKNVIGGYGGLWLRVDDEQEVPLVFDNMNGRGVVGTTKWTRYSCRLPYNAIKSNKIAFGGLLTGNGLLWMDNLTLTIDGKPVDRQDAKPLLPAELDTSFRNASGISSIDMTPSNIKNLTNLGLIWGFLKYYHPRIARGELNWDAELFRMLPRIINEPSALRCNKLFENWIDSLGAVSTCPSCDIKSINTITVLPDYGSLFITDNLPNSLRHKLAWIRDNHELMSENFYIGATALGNPIFRHESAYTSMTENDVGLRLLALFRYWNMIQYYYPYRGLNHNDWNNVLFEFLPIFIKARDSKEYLLSCLRLFARINDTHAVLAGAGVPLLDVIKGSRIIPIRTEFIENKLVVAGYESAFDSRSKSIQIGDVIEKINGFTIDSLIKKFIPFIPGSNFQVRLRNLSGSDGFLLRTNDELVHLVVIRSGSRMKVIIKTEDLVRFKNQKYLYTKAEKYSPQILPYHMLPNNLGYIDVGKLRSTDLNAIKSVFRNTKGIVFDLRNYPSTVMYDIYGKWLRPATSVFALITKPSVQLPGAMLGFYEATNGEYNPDFYKGKIVLLVNSSTQSQGEFTAMALGSIKGAKVIGDSTAGSDGNVSSITLPGRINTHISGLGIYYPDSTLTQGPGVKIDILIKQKLKSLKDGSDDLLEAGIKEIMSSN